MAEKKKNVEATVREISVGPLLSSVSEVLSGIQSFPRTQVIFS